MLACWVGRVLRLGVGDHDIFLRITLGHGVLRRVMHVQIAEGRVPGRKKVTVRARTSGFVSSTKGKRMIAYWYTACM